MRNTRAKPGPSARVSGRSDYRIVLGELPDVLPQLGPRNFDVTRRTVRSTEKSIRQYSFWTRANCIFIRQRSRAVRSSKNLAGRNSFITHIELSEDERAYLHSCAAAINPETRLRASSLLHLDPERGYLPPRDPRRPPLTPSGSEFSKLSHRLAPRLGSHGPIIRHSFTQMREPRAWRRIETTPYPARC